VIGLRSYKIGARAGAILSLAAFLSVMPAWADDAVEVTVADGLVNLNVDEPVPLTDVLNQLAILFPTTIEGESGSAIVKPVRIDRMTIAETLALILPGRSFVIESSGNRDEVRRVVIMEEKEAQGAPVSSITRIDHRPEPDRVRATAEALREVVKLSYKRDRASLKALKEIARTKGETSIRVAALRALANFAELGAVSFLGERLVVDSEPQIRLAAAEAIAQTNTAQSRDIIARAADSERDAKLRRRLRAIADMQPEQRPSEPGQLLYKGHRLQR
jgi:hypothetical protein